SLSRRAAAGALLEGGRADGWRAARLLSDVTDVITAALFSNAADAVDGRRLALVAVGGYGRGELAPHSDLDLLFLHDAKAGDFAKPAIERILFSIWDDLGLKVGHAVRNIDDNIALARADHTIQTGLLESRLVAGDQKLFDELSGKLRKHVFERDRAGYIAQKLRERDERHARIGASRYMVEPNIKEGKGGLRDLHTLFWIGRRRFGFSTPGEYVGAGVLSGEQASALIRARRFLWTVRFHLHLTAGRASERLTFDVQTEIAKRMGFASRDGATGVERFMKRYFLGAREVGGLTRIICAKLEAENTKRAPAGLGRFWRRQHDSGEFAAPGFHLETGRLNIDGPETLAAAGGLMRLFEIAEERDLDLHPRALEEAARRARRMPAAWRTDREAQESFLRVLASPRRPAPALRLMNDSGVLGRFVPEFGRVVAQMQFNMHHHYTVDEHTLRAVEAISEIEGGEHRDKHPLATTILPKIINRRALYLAMLLHDTGKGAGDQQIEGEKAALAACRRLGLARDEADLVGWLVRNHLLMSEVAQRRDIGEARTIAAFAGAVGNVERLRLLLILTVADMRAVGPGIWNDWKGQLLRDLYRLTEAALLGGGGEAAVRGLLEEMAEEAKKNLRQAGLLEAAAAEAWISTHEAGYWLDHEAEALIWHAAEANAAQHSGAHTAARFRPQRGITEILVIAPDRAGLFASLAAAISASGADIAAARAHTTKIGSALDVFSVQTSDHRPFGQDNPAALDALLKRLRRAATKDHASPVAPAPSRRRSAFAIEPRVGIDNDITSAATVIEASGGDRLGLLADLARACAAHSVSIVSAHIDTAGERASDVFYVQEQGGGQVVDPHRLSSLRAELEAVFSGTSALSTPT
ncbi:MAG: [protein-PII] uridylyltransferase, partial [Terricaulis sp.]